MAAASVPGHRGPRRDTQRCRAAGTSKPEPRRSSDWLGRARRGQKGREIPAGAPGSASGSAGSERIPKGAAGLCERPLGQPRGESSAPPRDLGLKVSQPPRESLKGCGELTGLRFGAERRRQGSPRRAPGLSGPAPHPAGPAECSRAPNVGQQPQNSPELGGGLHSLQPSCPPLRLWPRGAGERPEGTPNDPFPGGSTPLGGARPFWGALGGSRTHLQPRWRPA